MRPWDTGRSSTVGPEPTASPVAASATPSPVPYSTAYIDLGDTICGGTGTLAAVATTCGLNTDDDDTIHGNDGIDLIFGQGGKTNCSEIRGLTSSTAAATPIPAMASTYASAWKPASPATFSKHIAAFSRSAA